MVFKMACLQLYKSANCFLKLSISRSINTIVKFSQIYTNVIQIINGLLSRWRLINGFDDWFRDIVVIENKILLNVISIHTNSRDYLY